MLDSLYFTLAIGRDCLYLQTPPFVNVNIFSGVQELRVLKLGDCELIQNIVSEFALVHEFENISAVSLEEMICKDGVFSEVVNSAILDKL